MNHESCIMASTHHSLLYIRSVVAHLYHSDIGGAALQAMLHASALLIQLAIQGRASFRAECLALVVHSSS